MAWETVFVLITLDNNSQAALRQVRFFFFFFIASPKKIVLNRFKTKISSYFGLRSAQEASSELIPQDVAQGLVPQEQNLIAVKFLRSERSSISNIAMRPPPTRATHELCTSLWTGFHHFYALEVMWRLRHRLQSAFSLWTWYGSDCNVPSTENHDLGQVRERFEWRTGWVFTCLFKWYMSDICQPPRRNGDLSGVYPSPTRWCWKWMDEK